MAADIQHIVIMIKKTKTVALRLENVFNISNVNNEPWRASIELHYYDRGHAYTIDHNPDNNVSSN